MIEDLPDHRLQRREPLAQPLLLLKQPPRVAKGLRVNGRTVSMRVGELIIDMRLVAVVAMVAMIVVVGVIGMVEVRVAMVDIGVMEVQVMVEVEFVEVALVEVPVVEMGHVEVPEIEMAVIAVIVMGTVGVEDIEVVRPIQVRLVLVAVVPVRRVEMALSSVLRPSGRNRRSPGRNGGPDRNAPGPRAHRRSARPGRSARDRNALGRKVSFVKVPVIEVAGSGRRDRTDPRRGRTPCVVWPTCAVVVPGHPHGPMSACQPPSGPGSILPTGSARRILLQRASSSASSEVAMPGRACLAWPRLSWGDSSRGQCLPGLPPRVLCCAETLRVSFAHLAARFHL